MVYLYTCEACEEGRHYACERGHPAPAGEFGGSKCRCMCDGDQQFNSPEHIEKEMRRLIDGYYSSQKTPDESQVSISKKVRQLKIKIESADKEIRKLQEECKHPHCQKTHHSDTGNYDLSNDRFWTQCHCPDCDLYWTEEGSV